MQAEFPDIFKCDLYACEIQDRGNDMQIHERYNYVNLQNSLSDLFNHGSNIAFLSSLRLS